MKEGARWKHAAHLGRSQAKASYLSVAMNGLLRRLALAPFCLCAHSGISSSAATRKSDAEVAKYFGWQWHRQVRPTLRRNASPVGQRRVLPPELPGLDGPRLADLGLCLVKQQPCSRAFTTEAARAALWRPAMQWTRTPSPARRD